MNDDTVVEQVRAAMKQMSEQDPHDLYLFMIEKGIIDDKGRVLIRMPEPPQKPRTKRASLPPTADADETKKVS